MDCCISYTSKEILTRLPAKSLMRFKCVSKLWSSVISSRYFSNRFLTVPSPRLYICLWDKNDFRYISETLSLAPLDASPNPSSFVVDHDLTVPKRGGYILQNLRGFICFTYWKKPRIYNPATRKLVTLPGLKSNHIIVPPGEVLMDQYYFGYDPANDQFKVVACICIFSEEDFQVISSENWVLVLKRWR
ncbi:hypothetical protein EUTSA_v10009896mg, partial [Eutrema salsugineum]